MNRRGHDAGPARDDADLRRVMGEDRFDGRPREEFRRQLRMMIDHNARHHAPHRGLLAAVAVAAAVVLGVAHWTDLGGNSFDLVPTGHTVGGGTEVFTAPFDRGRYGAGNAGGSDGGRADLESFRERLATGVPAARVEGWTLRGRTHLVGTFEPDDGMRTLESTDPAVVADWLALSASGIADSLRARVEGGKIPVTRARLRVLDDGWSYFLAGYDVEVPGWGAVTYWRGEPAASR